MIISTRKLSPSEPAVVVLSLANILCRRWIIMDLRRQWQSDQQMSRLAGKRRWNSLLSAYHFERNYRFISQLAKGRGC